MHVNFVTFEHITAVVGAVIVFLVSAIALKNDWKTPGIENQVFKLMLALLAFGAVLAFFAGLGVIGKGA